MVKVYGIPGAEKAVVRESPDGINSFYDINSTETKLNRKLNAEKKDFFDNLPKTIEQEEYKLSCLEQKEKNIEELWDKKIDIVKDKIKTNKEKLSFKKPHFIFPFFWNYPELFVKKYYLKRRNLKKVGKEIKQQDNAIKSYKETPDEVFKDQQIDLISNITEIKDLKKTKDYRGAYGEVKFLEEMKKLDDEHYIFSDLNIDLGEYTKYKREKNLRSAQLDFVLVSRKGIFAVEVKNWGKNYRHRGFSPYEQVDRAGLVLYRHLCDYGFRKNVTRMLISIQGSLKYNLNYKSVLVNTISGFKNYLNNKRNVMSKEEMLDIVECLKNNVEE